MTHVDGRSRAARPRHDWSISNLGNRAIYCVLAGAVITFATGVFAIGLIIAVVLFVLASAIVAIRR